MKKVIVGIDPGQKGAIAIIREGLPLEVYDLKPCYKPTGSFNSLDPERLYHLILRSIPQLHEGVAVFCEESQLRHGNGIKTARPIYDSRGTMRTLLWLRKNELTYIQPQTWKRKFGLLKQDKFASCEKASELFPKSKHLFWKQHGKRELPLDGRAEAALIAHYGWLLDRAD